MADETEEPVIACGVLSEGLRSLLRRVVQDTIAHHTKTTADQDVEITEEIVRMVTPFIAGWRCFFCDEQFANRADAAEHFGGMLDDAPACKLNAGEKTLVGLLRESQTELRAYRDEDTALIRTMYDLGGKHTVALQREEEKGYERGMHDMQEAVLKALGRSEPPD